MVQPRNRSHCDADAVLTAEGNIRHTGMGGVVGIAGVASTGHAYKGTFREPRRAPCLSAYLGLGVAQPKDTWSPGGRGLPPGEANDLKRSLLWPREELSQSGEVRPRG